MLERVEGTQQGTGERVTQEARGCRKTGSAARWTLTERGLAIDVAPGNLVLAVALVEESELQGVIVKDPSQVVIDVDGSVRLFPGRGTEIATPKTGIWKAAKTQIRNRVRGIEQRQRNTVLGQRGVSVGPLVKRKSVTGTNGELIQQRRRNRAEQVHG